MLATVQKDMLTNDLTFKYVFSKNKVLEDFLKSFFEYMKIDINILIKDIIPESYIYANNKRYKSFFGDLVVTLSDTKTLSIEMYSNKFNKENYNKSLAYACRLYSNQDVKKKYKDFSQVISLNLVEGNYKKINNQLVNTYLCKNKDNNQEIDDNIIIYLIRYDLVDKIIYNKDEARFITYLRIIRSRSVEEMNKYAKGDKKMEELMEYVRKWNEKSNREGFIRFKNEIKEEGVKEGRKEGRKEGLRKGKEEGVKEAQINTAQQLIMYGFNEELISKITGLSKDKIAKLKK